LTMLAARFIFHRVMNLWAPPARRLPLVLALTTAFEGIRAGAGTFRLLLDLPARHSVGAVAFAAFSRATDLSTAGIVFYSLYGFGGAVLTGAAWVTASRMRAPRPVRTLAGVAFICSVLVLVFTTQAAPLMWSAGSAPDDPTRLGHLLDRFTFWTALRIGLADLSFLSVLSALTILAIEHRAVPSSRGLASDQRSDVAK
jgi:hypothetical protein